MINKGDWEFLINTQEGILAGRKCDPGDFHLIHRLGIQEEDPFSQEKIYDERHEYVEPNVRIMKGDERLVVAAGLLNVGDIVCTFVFRKGLNLSDVQEVVFKGITYYVKRYFDKGLGDSFNRKMLFCSRRK